MLISKNIAYTYVNVYADQRGRGIDIIVRKSEGGVIQADLSKEGHKVDYKIKSTTQESPINKTIYAVEFPKDKNAVYELFDDNKGLSFAYESDITGGATISSQFQGK